MTPTSPLLARTFMVGVLILSTAYGASALTVQRKNVLVDGTYTPALVVKHNGETIVHLIGEDGLTRSILFNRQKALAWVQAKYGAEALDVTQSGTGGGDGGTGISVAFDDGGDGGTY